MLPFWGDKEKDKKSQSLDYFEIIAILIVKEYS